jgi:hypothetical protein
MTRGSIDDYSAVTRGLDPRVHLLRKSFCEGMDGRVKPGHDEYVL